MKTLDCECIRSFLSPQSHAIADFLRGVAEHSHRSQLATDILNTMKTDLANFLNVPPSHEILIMQGAFDITAPLFTI
jgi:phosphoserine aminotransferase